MQVTAFMKSSIAIRPFDRIFNPHQSYRDIHKGKGVCDFVEALRLIVGARESNNRGSDRAHHQQRAESLQVLRIQR